MDQSVIAGLGNLLVDEICWRACVHPGVRLERLSKQRRDRVYGSMTEVLDASLPRGRVTTGSRARATSARGRARAAVRR